MRRESILETKTVYVADDGTQFSSEEKCREYEFKHKIDPVEEAASKLKWSVVQASWLKSNAWDDDLYVIFYPSSKEDQIVIDQWAKFRHFIRDEMSLFERRPAPCTIVLEAYGYNPSFDDLRCVDEVCSCLGTPEEIKLAYTKSVDNMIEYGKDHVVDEYL